MSDLTPDQILATLRVYNRFKPVRDAVELITDLQAQVEIDTLNPNRREHINKLVAENAALQAQVAALEARYESKPCAKHMWFDASDVYKPNSEICRNCGKVKENSDD